MSRVLHRSPAASYPVAASGEGPYLFDRDGTRYLDGSGGAAVSCLGHGHPEVVAAIQDQAARLAYGHTAFFTNEPAEALAEHLVADAPGSLDRVHFVSGGSEATETALKLARQHAVNRGEPMRRRVIARRQSYHGNTLAALAASGNPGRRVPFDAMLPDGVTRISPCYPYRGQRADEDEGAYGERMAAELEDAILGAGPETVLAFICEPVVGATLGAVPAVPGYLKRVREICDRYGVLLIFDEVMCGMGRTGVRYACSHDGAAPDLLTCAKGLAGGYQPLGAVLMSRAIAESIETASRPFPHGFTYVGHATACAAGLAVQRVIDRDDLLVNVTRQGAALRDDLAARFADHPHVGDIRGRGLFLGIELVADRESKRPFDPALALNARIKKAAFARGLICYPGGGTADGQAGDHVLLAPPFIIGDEHRAELVDKLADAIGGALTEIGA
ncbi:hypothetical protein SAMN05216241_101408 [Limimonas halophila]|uniref:Adenosylmethionine-8-amino-7-oxononanoate aminotransferase n=1 Tax=Limimonas halophila TaxID=1082479 RepID=A0A1G7LXK9_9PROT|nr:aspartate aminotransferase family protein [Limimonas halophila]SDF54121.1 hypothetical protein SAMN05216241_101408 [Limimonas halophila]